jgi:D-arabinono-1,4-lactone oxidase
MAGAEAESSVLLEGLRDDVEVFQTEEKTYVESRRREGTEEGVMGTNVFNKM